ncbi:MAG: GWxTD domain-containing protein [Candidatus Coatesbacteria bacterium]|nr:GWxTD domain-containing protein [Candidatus Coatesbacteria bacterium]
MTVRFLIKLCPLLLVLLLGPGCGGVVYLAYDSLDEPGKGTFDEIRYIATDEELGEFVELKPSERAEWLDAFWKRRDPTPDTPVNEYKLEHYKRLRYSEKKFGWGKKPGWKTDRGKILIKYGPPNEIESHPMGDVATMGGWYSKPYEKWSYDYIPYVGTDKEFLFVDVHMTGDYELSRSIKDTSNSPEEKVQASGFDQAAQASPSALDDYDVTEKFGRDEKGREGDYSYRRSTSAGGGVWETKADGTTLSEESIIDIEQGVNDPFKAAVPITPGESTLELTVGVLTFDSPGRANMVEFDFVIPNIHLQFEIDEQEGFKAEMVISTRLYDSERRLVGGTVRRRFATERVEEDTAARDRFFIYIAGALLEPGVYEIEAVAVDQKSERYGYVRQTFEVRIIEPRRLSLSSIELASTLRPATELSMFVKHGYEVLPNPAGVYRMGGILGVYYEIYNLTIAGTGAPKFMIQYSISTRDDPENIIFSYKFLAPEEGGPNQMQVYRLALRPDVISPGEFALHVRVVDIVEGIELLAQTDFEVIE